MHFISSAMASFCLETTVEDAMQTVPGRGFDSLDFPLSVYSRPQDAPLRGDDWRQWARGVRRTADRIGLPITQAHASWEQAIPDDLHYESPYEIYERTMEACAILGCRQLIFHPVLYLHRMPDRSLWPRIHDWNVRWFHELLPLAEKFDHCDQSGKHVRLSPSAAAGRRARALHNRPRHAGARLRHWLEPCAALPRHRPCPHQRAGRARR